MSTAPQAVRRPPNPIAVLIRIIVITLAFAILGLGVGGLFGIISVSLINLSGQSTNMYMALFAGGLPGAAVGALVGLIVIVRLEWKAMRAPSDQQA